MTKHTDTREKLIYKIKEEYLELVQMDDEDTRKREFVEMRAALMNNMMRVCQDNEVAAQWGKHRPTTYHARKSHTMYWRSSPLYRNCYIIAEQLVDKHSLDLLSTTNKRMGRGGRSDVLTTRNTLQNELMTLRLEADELTDEIDRLMRERDRIRTRINILDGGQLQ